MLGCCQLKLISLSSMIVLQPPLLCKGWDCHPLCVWGQFSTEPVIAQLTAEFCPSGQYLSFLCEAFFSERSWTVVAHKWSSLSRVLLLFFLRFSSISLTLYFSDTSGSNILFLSSLLLSQRSRNSEVTRFFLFFLCNVCKESHWLFQSLLC